MTVLARRAWTLSPHATHVEAVFDEASPGSVLVEHFNDPYHVELKDDSDDSLRGAAHAYLSELLAQPVVAADVTLPAHWLPALAPQQDPAAPEWHFGWLPFEPAAIPGAVFIGPYGSFRFESPSDKLAALYASERLSAQVYTGSGFGLALAMHLRQESATTTASFVGMSATLPYGPYLSHPLSSERLLARTGVLSVDALFRGAAIGTMAAAANLEDFVVRSVRIALPGDEVWIERQGVGLRRAAAPAGYEGEPGTQAVPYAVTMLSVRGGAADFDRILHVAPLVADAAGDARVFDADPSSMQARLVRPTRNEQADALHPIALDPLRRVRSIFSGGSQQGPLQYPDGAADPIVSVMPCPRYVRRDRPLPSGAPRPVALSAPDDPAIRSDDASAIQAFFHTRDLVRRIEQYGWANPADYFRLTKPAIRIFYRSGIVPGPGKDGRTINARVIPEGWSADALRQTQDDQTRPAIEIHLGCADLRRRERKPWTAGGAASPAIPFGVAADRRWMWHEFGHALLVASTGELELRFAHSPGDAMAAIVADPESQLPPRLRGMTFPFVFLPRHHNRSCQDGWSWSGTLHAGLKRVSHSMYPRRKGYTSEQILSSSLFRLYRCIGGDTHEAATPATADVHERRRASHYTLYLIMQAMHLMGDARIQATSTPAGFVHWLRQADRQTGEWAATFDGSTFRRVGGTLAKTIRWAFEAQGLYGSGNQPGEPEPVDIYIDDLRPAQDDALYGKADFGRGSYVPTSLHWQPADASVAAGTTPAWQSDPATGIVWQQPQARVEVLVGNRGGILATGVKVKLWFASWASNTAPPSWDAGVWTACAASGPATRDIPAGRPSQQLAFAFTFNPGPGRYVLFAEASCDDDRANSDPALSLAASQVATPMADLVATDNNLGLRVVEI